VRIDEPNAPAATPSQSPRDPAVYAKGAGEAPEGDASSLPAELSPLERQVRERIDPIANSFSG
jgi:hypothetical protein